MSALLNLHTPWMRESNPLAPVALLVERMIESRSEFRITTPLVFVQGECTTAEIVEGEKGPWDDNWLAGTGVYCVTFTPSSDVDPDDYREFVNWLTDAMRESMYASVTPDEHPNDDDSPDWEARMGWTVKPDGIYFHHQGAA